MFNITIYHNPRCSNSRNVLEIIRNAGFEPEIVEYLKTPLKHGELAQLIAKMNVPVRSVLRSKEALYEELRLDEPKWSEQELIDFMVVHPILMNRPIVVTPIGAKLCRPPETVLELLPRV